MFYTIETNENAEPSGITAYETVSQVALALPEGGPTFSTLSGFQAVTAEWPITRLVDLWNLFAGAPPFGALKQVKKFETRAIAVKRIWAALDAGFAPFAPAADPATSLPEATEATITVEETETMSQKKKTARKKASPRAQSAQDAPKKAKATKPATEVAGTRKAEVLAMISRKRGATLAEIMTATGWQKHTVRGFMAGAIKKAGYDVESFKPEGGERTYRINS